MIVLYNVSGLDMHVGVNWDELKWHAERYFARFRILTYFLPSLQSMNVIDLVSMNVMDIVINVYTWRLLDIDLINLDSGVLSSVFIAFNFIGIFDVLTI